MYVYSHIRPHIYSFTPTFTHSHTCVCVSFTHSHIHTHVCVSPHAFTHTHVCILTHSLTHTCLHTHLLTHKHLQRRSHKRTLRLSHLEPSRCLSLQLSPRFFSGVCPNISLHLPGCVPLLSHTHTWKEKGCVYVNIYMPMHMYVCACMQICVWERVSDIYHFNYCHGCRQVWERERRGGAVFF